MSLYIDWQDVSAIGSDYLNRYVLLSGLSRSILSAALTTSWIRGLWVSGTTEVSNAEWGLIDEALAQAFLEIHTENTPMPNPPPDVALYEHVTAEGVNGGSAIVGNNIRTLNSITIPATWATKDGDIVTCGPGAYTITAHQSTYGTGHVRSLLLIGHPGGSVWARGTSCYARASISTDEIAPLVTTYAEDDEYITIMLILEVQLAKASNGLGVAFWDTNCYAQLFITRLGDCP